MAVTLMWNLQNIWPFSSFKYGDMTLSKHLVSKLSIPEDTKQFVFAIRDPQTQSIIYILSTLNLSKRSAFDVECLIKEIRPDVVVIQAGHSPWTEIQSEESELELDAPIPTSSFGAIKQCFVDKVGKEKYENIASNYVLREIFGTSFHRHLMVAKRAAEEVGSSFVVLESQLGKFSFGNNDSDDNNPRNKFQSLISSLVPHKGSLQQTVKALSLHTDPPLLDQSSLVSGKASKEIQPSSYETPDFARVIYPLFEGLHNIYADFPSIGRSLANVQKLLLDVNRGEVLDTKVISEVYTFRVAVEGLRIALSKSGLKPSSRKDISDSAKIEFSKLPTEDKSHVILAQAIRSQTDKFKTIVAVVDAGGLAGIRKHWHTPLPAEFKDLLEKVMANPEGVISNPKDNTRSLTEKLIVLVSAAGTIILGTSSVTRVILALKTPTTLKLFLSQTQRALAFSVASSKAVAPGIATSGAKTSAVMKVVASIGKKRGITQFFIATAEKMSNVAMRTAFYEIMRKRKLQQKPVGFLPWAALACSVGTIVGLKFYGDGVERAVESLPAAPSIARLGRGVQNLREASQVAMQTEGTRIRNSIESLINRMKKGKAH